MNRAHLNVDFQYKTDQKIQSLILGIFITWEYIGNSPFNK